MSTGQEKGIGIIWNFLRGKQQTRSTKTTIPNTDRTQNTHPKYFHGGVPGREIGQKILSRAAMPAWTDKAVNYGQHSAEEFGSDGTWVHFTTDLEVARGYAGEYIAPNGQYEPGTVYEVVPIGSAGMDPDFEWFPQTFLRARAARITTIAEKNILWKNPRLMARATAQYRIFRDDPTLHLYDADGYISLTESFLKHGATQEKAFALGKWIPVHMINFDLTLKSGFAKPPELQ